MHILISSYIALKKNKLRGTSIIFVKIYNFLPISRIDDCKWYQLGWDPFFMTNLIICVKKQFRINLS